MRIVRRRVLLAVAMLTVAVGVLNIVLAMLPSPVAGIDDLVPGFALQGSRFVLLVLGMTMVFAARSLSHGKRMAWLIAAAAAGGSLAAHPVKDLDFAGAAASAALLAVLVATHRLFTARSDPPTAARGLLVFAVGTLANLTYGTIALYLLDREFSQSISFARAFGETFRLMLILPPSSLEPVSSHGTWLVDSVRLFFVVVLLYSLSRWLHPVIHRRTIGHTEHEHVSRLLEQHGRTAISFFALLSDKSYYFSPSGNAVLAYKVMGSTAIVMGDPIGEAREFRDLLLAFQEQCELDDWTFALYQATPAHLGLYRELGLKALKIGEEATIDLGILELKGQEHKHLRNVLNRFQREGFQAEVVQPPLPASLLRQLREVSDDWLSQPGYRERTFTLGQFSEPYVRETPAMVVRDPQRAVIAFANIIPSYRLADGNFDLMRHRRDAPRYTMDFLILSLALHFRQAGYAGLNLGLAPFSGTQEASSTVAAGAMHLLYEYGTYLFRYKGLRQFKEKFHPVWEPRYLVYRSDLQLPGLALAVARAGEIRGRQHPPAKIIHAQAKPAAA